MASLTRLDDAKQQHEETIEQLFEKLVRARNSFQEWSQRGTKAINDPNAMFPPLW